MVGLLFLLSVPVSCIGPSVIMGTLYGWSINEPGRGFWIGLLVGVVVSIGCAVVLEIMGIPFLSLYLVVLSLVGSLPYADTVTQILLVYGVSQVVGVGWTLYWTGRTIKAGAR